MSAELWTLPELAELVAGALSAGYDGQQSRRVTDVPDIRAIRYYTTIGVVDRPAAMRGRTALYGQRHLWQLVAIKRLQATGHSLAEIQQKLTGASDGALRQLALLPAESFWRRGPAPSEAIPSSAPSAEPARPSPALPELTLHPPTMPATEESTVYQALRLEGGTVVLIPHRQSLTDREIATLRAVAAPLVAAVSRLPKGRP